MEGPTSVDAERPCPYGPEWECRQKNLRLDTKGEWLKPDEILSLERFQQLEPQVPLSDKIVWIRRDEDSFLPTDDFKWTANNGIRIEMKHVHRAEYRPIHDAINGSIRKLKKNHPGLLGVKENFMIDIGRRQLRDGLRVELEDYNIRNPLNPLKRLWILWDEHLEEIALR